MKSSSFALTLLLCIDLIFLLYGVHTLSISSHEADIFFHGKGFVHYLTQISTQLFGQNDYALRAPFIFFHLASIVLIYNISKFYLRRKEDQLLSAGLFVLLPGVVSSALLVNSASVVIFFTLFFIYLYLRKKESLYLSLLPLLLVIDDAFIILYFVLFIYGLSAKNNKLIFFSATLFLLGLYLYGFQMGGKPRGYFLDTFGAYALIFSPLLFLYFFYTMYRILVREKKTLLWVISFSALVLSLLLSFRQRIMIEDFAPFVVVSIPLMVQVFMKSYRTRLPELRRTHNFMFVLVFFFLLVNFYATYFNQYFYRFISTPQTHFAYKYHIAYELATQLKAQGISSIMMDDKKMQERLRFYGIKADSRYKLIPSEVYHDSDSVTIRYMDFPIMSYNVSKLNKN